MELTFPSEEWLQALVNELNSSDAYREAAKDWEGDFYFIIEPEDKTQDRVVAYMDLWHGQCRSACMITDEKDKSPEFKIRAPQAKWRKIFEKKLNPIQAMLTGQLKVSGNMMKIVKKPRSAVALVECCCNIPTTYLS
jgi:putative sterol carrier protein